MIIIVAISKGQFSEPIDTECTITINKIVTKTKKIKNSTIAEYEYCGEFEANPTDKIIVCCYHSGMFYNSVLGSLEISVSDHLNTAFEFATANWYNLSNSNQLQIKIGISTPKISTQSSPDELLSSDELWKKNESIISESSKSVDRSLQLLIKSKNLGTDILINLDAQDQQLDHFKKQIADTNHNLDLSERKIRSIESVFGTAANAVTSAFVDTTTRSEPPLHHSNHYKRSFSDAPTYHHEIIIDGTTSEERCQQHQITIDDRYDQMLNIVGELNEQAIDIGKMIDKQNKKLDSIINETDKLNNRVGKINRRLN